MHYRLQHRLFQGRKIYLRLAYDNEEQQIRYEQRLLPCNIRHSGEVTFSVFLSQSFSANYNHYNRKKAACQGKLVKNRPVLYEEKVLFAIFISAKI